MECVFGFIYFIIWDKISQIAPHIKFFHSIFYKEGFAIKLEARSSQSATWFYQGIKFFKK